MHPLRVLRTAAVLLAALGTLPRPAGATELVLEQLGVADGEVRARVRIVDLLDAGTRRAVASGLPVTVRVSVDLWRDRRRWFDEHVDARVSAYRLRWDPRERWYTLTHPGPARRVDTYERLDDLLADLEERDIPVHPQGALDRGARYFAVIEVAVRPLTLEEFRDLDGWLGGKLRGAGDPGAAPDSAGSEEGLSGAVFGFLLDAAGFGDVIRRERTPPFRPAELPDLPDAPAPR
jgi:hypothetical protein